LEKSLAAEGREEISAQKNNPFGGKKVKKGGERRLRGAICSKQEGWLSEEQRRIMIWRGVEGTLY